MIDIKNLKQKAVTFFTVAVSALKTAVNRFKNSEKTKAALNALSWNNLRPRLTAARKAVVSFTVTYPKTACFIYVCVFCAFSINFIDLPVAVALLREKHATFFTFWTAANPSGWWFLILGLLWLVYMAVAGLSLTTESFEKNLLKAHDIAFVGLTLCLSSLVTLFLNILIGRYPPEFLDTMNLYGFSAFRFRFSETSFPCFAVQSIWAVAMAAASITPKTAGYFFKVIAAIVTLSVIMTAECFVSDAVMGGYIGVMMYYTAKWIVSENRENTPLFTK